MTKSGGFATCDDCGRCVSYTPRRRKSSSSSAQYGLADALLGLGIMGMVGSLNGEREYRKHRSIGQRVKHFLRNLLYSLVAFAYIAIGGMIYYYIDDLWEYSVFSWIGIILISFIMVWCAILTFYLKGKTELTAKNIIGSVFVNAVCKVTGVIIPFTGFLPFWFSFLLGVFLFIVGHYLYKEIKDG